MENTREVILGQRSDWEKVIADNISAILSVQKNGGKDIVIEADTFYRHRQGGSYKYNGHRNNNADKCLRIILYTGLMSVDNFPEVKFIMVVFEKQSATFGSNVMRHHFIGENNCPRKVNIRNASYEKMLTVCTRPINEMSEAMKRERIALIYDIMANGKIAYIKSNLQRYDPFLSNRDNPEKLDRIAEEVAITMRKEKELYHMSLPSRFIRHALVHGKNLYNKEWGLYPVEKQVLITEEGIALLSDLAKRNIYLLSLLLKKRVEFTDIEYTTRKELLERDVNSQLKAVEFLKVRLEKLRDKAKKEILEYDDYIFHHVW